MNGAISGARASESRPVAHCPQCGQRYASASFVQEYWTSERRVFTCWCAHCRFVCDVIAVDRVVSFEPEH